MTNDTFDSTLHALIRAAVRDDNYLVRGAAVRALGKLRHPEAVRPLLNALREKNGFVYDFALAALAEMQPAEALPELLAMAAEDDVDLQRAAAVILGRMRHAEATPALLKLLRVAQPAVQAAAAEALGEIGNREAVPTLLTTLQQSGADGVLAIAIIDALGKLGDPAAAEALIDLLAVRWAVPAGVTSAPPVRKHVVAALAGLGPAALPALLARVRDNEVKVRHGVIEALGEIAAGGSATPG